jgi:hypothetical protein
MVVKFPRELQRFGTWVHDRLELEFTIAAKQAFGAA